MDDGGKAVLIDTEYNTWNIDPTAMEKAFELYPEVCLIVIIHLYGNSEKGDEIKAIADKHNALIMEVATEYFCAAYKCI